MSQTAPPAPTSTTAPASRRPPRPPVRCPTREPAWTPPDTPTADGGNGDAGLTPADGGASDAGSSEDGAVDSGADAGPPFCGDGVVNTPTEQCDDGANPAPSGLCTTDCKVQEQLVTPASPDAGFVSRTLGLGRHPLASGNGAFAVTYVERTPQRTQLFGRVFDAHDNEGAPLSLAPAADALGSANPVVAPLPDGTFAAAFASPNVVTGDESDVLLAHLGSGDAGASSLANGTVIGSQYDPDAIWTGTDLVVAWTDTSNVATSPDIRMRRFDGQLNPRESGDEALAVTGDLEGDVALAAFGGTWAAAWRASASDGEYVRAQTPAASWSVGPYLAGPDDARPALVPIDATHLLVVYLEGLDDSGAGFATSYVLRGVVLDAAAKTAGDPFNLTGADGAPIEALEVNASRAGSAIGIGWRSPAAPGSVAGEELALAYWTNVMSPADVQAPLSPVAIPENDAHRTGDQRSFALAPVSGAPAQLVAAWDDLGRSFGPGEGTGDVVVERLPPVHADPSVAVDITIDATPLAEQQIQIVGVTPSFDSKTIYRISVPPGGYALLTGGGYVLGPDGGTASIVVKNDGTLDYDHYFDHVYQGRGTTTLKVTGSQISVDARALTEQPMQIVGITPSYDSRTPPSPLFVTPGSYAIFTGGGYVLGPAGSATSVTVNPDGTLDYDDSMKAIYSGRGTSALVVNAFSISVDATSLTEQQMQVVGITPSYDNKAGPTTLFVTPGAYAIYTDGLYVLGPGGALTSVTVGADGMLDYDASLNQVYSGRGTTALVVHGFSISVDATSLTEQQMQVVGITPSYDNKAPPFSTLVLTPGAYAVYTGGEYILGPGGSLVTVIVNNDGTLDYDHSLDLAYSGRGTTALTVNGFGVSIDASSLTEQQMQVVGITPSYDNKAPPSPKLFLSPGAYAVYTAGAYILGPGGSLVTVVVENDGTLDYDPSLNQVYSGRGTTALTVNGFSVTIDGRPLAEQQIYLNGVTPSYDSKTPPQPLFVAPGSYAVYSGGGWVTGADGSPLSFLVGDDGTFAYDGAIGNGITGATTNALVLNGFPIQVDARAHPGEVFAVDGVTPWFDGSALEGLQLLPGTYTIDGPASASLGGAVVKDDGTLDYDPTLNGTFEGRGTSTLVIP